MRSHPCMFSVKILHLLRMTAILLILRFYLLNLRSAQLNKWLFILRLFNLRENRKVYKEISLRNFYLFDLPVCKT